MLFGKVSTYLPEQSAFRSTFCSGYDFGGGIVFPRHGAIFRCYRNGFSCNADSVAYRSSRKPVIGRWKGLMFHFNALDGRIVVLIFLRVLVSDAELTTRCIGKQEEGGKQFLFFRNGIGYGEIRCVGGKGSQFAGLRIAPLPAFNVAGGGGTVGQYAAFHSCNGECCY